MITVIAAGLTDVGQKRKGNEDAFLIDDQLQLYVVADGMGGRKAGEVASRLVVDTIRKTMQKLVSAENPDQMVGVDRNLSSQANHLVYAIRRANLKTYEYAQNDKSCKGMGSTVSAVYFSATHAIVSNVGDSPVFLVREGRAEIVSSLHTVMAEQEAIAPEGGLKLGQQYLHMITRAMGIHETVNPDTTEIFFQEGDALVICSDGLSDKAFPEEICEIVESSAPEESCRKLIEMANDRGGDDNITVIVLQLGPRIESQRSTTVMVAAGEAVAEKALPELMVEYDTEDASYSTATRALRLDGIFLETSEPFTKGEELMLNITDPRTQTTLMLSGIIVGRKPRGIEVTFDDLKPSQLETLKALIREL
jgi:serine/threonine protein phosphatase PrpC/Tfp pilus assembly protein PilZ